MSARERGGLFEPQSLRVFLCLLASILVGSLTSVIGSTLFRPDLTTLIVVFLALEHEFLPGLFLAAAVGYLSDLVSGLGPGLDATTNVLVYLLLRVFVARIAGGRLVMVTTLGLVSTLFALVVRQCIEATIGPGQAALWFALPALPSVAIGAILLAYPVYRLFLALDRVVQPREEQGYGRRPRSGGAT